MRRYTILLLLGAALLGGCNALPKGEGQVVQRGGGQPDLQRVKSGNAKMNAAMSEARRTVPQFLAALQNPTPTQTGFSVKVKVTDGTHTEFMWLDDVAYDGSNLSGRFVDDPYEVKGYKTGQTFTVKPGEIADWIIADNGKRLGGYTVKVLEEMSRK